MVRKNNSEIKRSILFEVPKENRFICVDSKIFKTIEDLEIALKSMKPGVFNYHVNKQKNDFSTWIYDIVGAVDLANEIREITNKKIMHDKVKSYISKIKKEIKK